MNITITIPDEHLAALRQHDADVLDPETGQPKRVKVDRPYGWAEVKFDPRTGRVLYTALRDSEVGDARYLALERTAQVEMGDKPPVL